MFFFFISIITIIFLLIISTYFAFFNNINDIVATIESAAINIIGASSIPAFGFFDGWVGSGVEGCCDGAGVGTVGAGVEGVVVVMLVLCLF